MHKYKKSFVGILAIIGVAVIMTSFGIDLSNQRHEQHAVQIDKKIISFRDFAQEKRQVQERYRSMLGENYPMFEKTLSARLSQQVVDKVISDTLLTRAASAYDMYTGTTEVQKTIMTQLFPGGFDASQYSSYLDRLETNPAAFEHKLSEELLRNQLVTLVSHASIPSVRETKANLLTQKIKYNVDYVEASPEQFKDSVKIPGDDVLKSLYETKASDFETAAQVAYDYAVLSPDSMMDQVEVNPQDVEVFYADNQSQFNTPPQIHARHIQLSWPKGADQAAKNNLKSRADALRTKLAEGESFDKIAKDNSDDFATNNLGGDMGWLSPGKMSKAFDEAAFKLKAGDLSGVVEGPNGLEIIKVEEVKPGEPKKLEEVRAQIEREIRKREAPAYIASKGQDFVDALDKGKQSLTEFGAGNKLAVKTAALSAKEADPAPTLKGLTAKVLANPDQKHQLIIIGDQSVLVSVTDYKPSEVPPFEKVKDKVVEQYRIQESSKAARQALEDLIKGIEDGKQKDLTSAAAAAKLSVKQEKDITSQTGPGIFANPEIRGQLLNAVNRPSKVFEQAGKFYVYQVASKVEPKQQDLDSELIENRRKETDELAQTTTMAMLNQLKSQSKIDVDPSLLAVE